MTIFDERATLSSQLLIEFRRSLGDLGAKPGNACVYATGSVARGEASADSDVDIFIVDVADEERGGMPLSNIDAVLLRSDLIRAGRNLGLPEFSGDGIYLDVHKLSALINNLGDPIDDYSNSFTARLLLMLESKPLLNEAAHRIARKSVAETYFRDYPGNSQFFLPVFLANDIMRYWKTLCLNYESQRNAGAPSGYDAERWKRRNRLRDIKLKFSRMWMTHSALAFLLAKTAEARTVSPEDVLEMMDLSPRERFEIVADLGADKDLVARVLQSYSWFLTTIPSGKDAAYEWVGDRERWMEAKARGQAFGDSVFDLLQSFSEDSALFRYLVG